MVGRGDAGAERVQQRVEALAGQRRDRERRRGSAVIAACSCVLAGLVPAIHVFFRLRTSRRRRVDARIKSGHDDFALPIARVSWVDQVDLVGDADRVGTRPRRGADGVGGMARVEDEEPDLGFRGAAPGAAQTFLLDRVGAVAQPRGVGEHHRVAGKVDRDLDDVARRAGDRRGDRGLAPRDAVQQTRLAGVGRADDRDHDAVAQPLAAPAVGEVTRDFAGERADLAQDALLDCHRQVFIGEVDRGFEMGEDAGQPP